jgi:hypothetical protein
LNATQFWARVDKKTDDECWNINIPKYSKSIRYKGICYIPHRLAYFLTYGEIADRTNIFRTCKNEYCCNPKHLSLGSKRQDVSFLTDEDKANMKVLHQSGKSYEQIARKFRVKKDVVSRAVKKVENV